MDDQAQYVGGVPELRRTIRGAADRGPLLLQPRDGRGRGHDPEGHRLDGPGRATYASDYPHLECRFPSSVDFFLSWETLTDDLKRTLLMGQPAALLR